MNILLTLLFGAIAGWLAGFFVIKDKGRMKNTVFRQPEHGIVRFAMGAS